MVLIDQAASATARKLASFGFHSQYRSVLSDYEKQRAQTIKENNERLAALGLLDTAPRPAPPGCG